MTFKKYKEETLKDPRSEDLKFEPDGRLHYVYRVSKDGKHYYGSKSELSGILEESIGIKYFTSSSVEDFKNDFRLKPENYKIKIVRKFNNTADKIIFESYLHNYLQVSSNDNFINKMNQTPFGINSVGFKHTPDTILLMSDSAIKANAEIRSDLEKYQTRSKNQSESSIKAHIKIASDPIRSATRSKNHSIAAIKFQAEIKADPIRREEQLKNMSIASTKTQAEIRSDPVRSEQRSKKASKSGVKAQAKINEDPDKKRAINKKKSKPGGQYDLKDNFIKEFFGQREAADQLGYTNSSGICSCVNGRCPHYKGFIWKAH